MPVHIPRQVAEERGCSSQVGTQQNPVGRGEEAELGKDGAEKVLMALGE